ncbi:GNAT family N-acetyltransferase [Aquimarina sp. M1]
MLYKEIYRLKRVDNDDFPAIKELFWKVFRKKVSLQYLQNKYDTSYLGIKYICSIAYHGDTPVAFYGAIPQKFSSNHSEVFVAQGIDSSTLQSFQGQGLHYQLAKFSYDIMKQKGIKFVYSFLNENSYYSTKKLLWKEYIHLQRFHIKVRTVPIARVLNKLACNHFYSVFFKKNILKKDIKLLRTYHSDKFQQNFDHSFIDYKNRYQSHYCIKLEGCIFWLKIQAIIHVGRFYAPSEIALQKAIKKLKQKAFFLGVSELLFQVHPESIMASQLKTIVTPKESWLVGYLDFDPEIDLNDFKFTYSDLDTF